MVYHTILRLSVATVLGVGAVAVAAPAQAMPVCRAVYSISAATDAIQAAGNAVCYDTGRVTPLPVSIQRRDPGTGVWSTVSTDTGHARYECVGTASISYRVQQDPIRTVTAPCG